MEIPKNIERRGHDGSMVEVPFAFIDEITQDCAVEAMVLDVRGRELTFVVTDILDGEANLERGHSIAEYRTAQYGSPWFRRLRYDPHLLRGLSERSEGAVVDLTDYPDTLDDLELPDGIQRGSFVHIHANIYWGTTEGRGGKTGVWDFEVCKKPGPNVDPEDFVHTNQTRTTRLAKQLLRSMEHREYLDMQRYERATPNTLHRPFADAERYRSTERYGSREEVVYVKRHVFGAGPVKDHYLDVVARPASDYYTELGGIERFGNKGTHFFVPNEMPFGSLNEEEDPLYRVEIKLHSGLVHSPALEEQRLYVVVDGVRYVALTDHEQSSHNFTKPGRRLHFDGVRRVGQENDMYVVAPEQSAALLERKMRQYQIVKTVLNEALEDNGSLFLADFDEIEDEAGRRIEEMRAEATEQNRVIAEILGDQEPEYKNPQGAALLLPRSMLDAIEIELPVIAD